MARYARRAIAVAVVSAGLFFGLSATAWATEGHEGHDDKQQIQAGDTKPGGASPTGSTTGRDTGKPAEAAGPSGLKGEATSATRTALASPGGTPSKKATTSERSGAGSQAPTGSRNPDVLDSAVTDASGQVAQAVRTLPAAVDRVTGAGATGGLNDGLTDGLTAVASPTADSVDATGAQVQAAVVAVAEAGERPEDGPIATVPGTDIDVPTLPAVPAPDDTTPAETTGPGAAFPLLLGGVGLPMLPRGSADAVTLPDIGTSTEETPDGGAPIGGLDQSVPTDEPRPTGPEGNGPGPVVGGATQLAGTLVDVRLPDAHHVATVPADAWRLPGSVTFEPGHSPD